MRMSRLCSLSAARTGSAIFSNPELAKALSAAGRGLRRHHISGGLRIEEAGAARQDVPMIDTDSLANRGFAVAPGLIGPDQCRALAALWPDKARFRSHVIMQRHGYGQGEYQYFTYPLPGPVETLRQALYPELAADRQPLERTARPRQALPAHAGGLAAAVPPGRPEAADAAAAALRAGRLQLPAPRPLWRAGVPAAGDRAAERSRARLQRRRVHAGRAAAAHAVARRGRAAAARATR